MTPKTKQTPNEEDPPHTDTRFLDYRLTQLEQKLEKGLTTLEQEQNKYNLEILKTLQTLQDGQNKTTETLAQIKERQTNVEEKLKCIDKLKDITSKNSERIRNNYESTNHRIDIVQKILFAIGGAAVSALFAAILSIIQMFLLR
jgi:DNA repair exonuclease SbcCD ATPase subunit